ncbi:hypothetical protein MHW47_07760 [Streptomyces sp. OfavH-34-F]|uniref:hypothetical protein n=1 Tax=Streptomyces sp. OfavH-34-F TaxID=2917760 RepID=UPI001EF2163C|nr:hypothetical protein [Streptomyces sp. OfavH-34-F]MCG7524333.1 hypothetical protein [Streptomyces sp. OfavH-34-F]
MRELEAGNAQQRALQKEQQASRNRVHEAAIGDSYEIERDWRQARIGIEVKAIQDKMDRELEESPFSYTPSDFHALVHTATRGGDIPALLVAPFVRDNLSGQENTDGPHSFRVAIRRKWLQSPWSNDLVSLDGALKRPLIATDVDIFHIQKALHDLPVILIYGEVQSSSRVWPALCAWNIVDSPDLRSVQVNFPPVALPPASPQSSHNSDSILAFEDELGGSTAITAGLIAEWFHLVRHGRIPRLHTLIPAALEAERRVIAAGLAASFDVALERNRVDVVSARLGQARVYLDAGLREQAISAASQALIAAESSEDQVPTHSIRQLAQILDSLGLTEEARRARIALESVARRAILRNFGWGNQ